MTTARATERSRKAFARRQWRRRWLTWRYVAALVVLILLAGASVWALWWSSWLSVKGVHVTGTDQITSQQVRDAAGVPLGGPLVAVDLEAAEARVEALAAVRSVDVSRQWPDEVLLEVTERQPLAVVQIGDRVRALDEEGVLFLDYRNPPGHLPRVQTPPGTDASALREAADVVSSLPDTVARIVDHVKVETVDRITLALRDGRSVVWGSAEDSEQKALVLTALLRQKAEVYDVSVPGQPTTSD